MPSIRSLRGAPPASGATQRVSPSATKETTPTNSLADTTPVPESKAPARATRDSAGQIEA